MPIQYNLYEYKLLLLQQLQLYHELEKYIFLENKILWSLENIEQLLGVDTIIMRTKVYEIIASLQEARTSNIYLSNELQKRIMGIYELLKISKDTSH